MAEKKADRKYPCKVVVFKNKVKCLPTVTVLLLATISPPEGGRTIWHRTIWHRTIWHQDTFLATLWAKVQFWCDCVPFRAQVWIRKFLLRLFCQKIEI